MHSSSVRKSAPARSKLPGHGSFLQRRNKQMVNDSKNLKDIEQIRKKFHIIANSPPRYNPFTAEGNQAWDNWTERCRGYEAELKEAGEYF
jgi:hypothetical protein